MSASFASQEWADSLSAHLQDSAAVRTESMSWVFGPIVLEVDADAEHAFEATALRLDLHEGESRGVNVVGSGVAKVVPFVLGGSLARWRAVFGGQLSLVDAVLDSRLRATGDLPTLARHRGLLDAIASAGGAVETTWQDAEPTVPA